MTSKCESQVRRARQYAAALIEGLNPTPAPIPVRIALRNHTLAELHAQRALNKATYDNLYPFHRM